VCAHLLAPREEESTCAPGETHLPPARARKGDDRLARNASKMRVIHSLTCATSLLTVNVPYILILFPCFIVVRRWRARNNVCVFTSLHSSFSFSLAALTLRRVVGPRSSSSTTETIAAIAGERKE